MNCRFAIARMWLAAALLTASFVTIHWVRQGYTFEVSPPRQGLENLPHQLDGWDGTDEPIDENVLKLLAADSLINRLYQHPQYGNVMLHASVWVQPQKVASVAPHLPKVCYSNVGWTPLDERQVTLTVDGSQIPLSLILFEKQANHIVVAYWYQLGDVRFTTAEEAREIHRRLWGQPLWPATVKVLLQVPAESIDDGLPTLERFISLVSSHFAQL